LKDLPPPFAIIFYFCGKPAIMPAVKRKKTASKKKRKIRFRKVVMKMTESQKKKIDRYCMFHQTTFKKMVKVAIAEYIENHGGEVAEDEPVSRNQLKLFDPEDFKNTGKQMNLFDSH
jgi:hypothetical protein